MDAPHAGVDGPPRRETPPIAASVAGTVFVRGRFPAFPPACRQRSLFLVVAGAIRRCSIRFTVRSVVMFMRTGSAGRRRASAVLAGSHRSPPPRTVYTLYTVMCLLCTQWIVRERERERERQSRRPPEPVEPPDGRPCDHPCPAGVVRESRIGLNLIPRAMGAGGTDPVSSSRWCRWRSSCGACRGPEGEQNGKETGRPDDRSLFGGCVGVG